MESNNRSVVNNFLSIANWSPLWQFALFTAVLLVLANWTPTAPYALGIAALILLGQLYLISQKGLT